MDEMIDGALADLTGHVLDEPLPSDMAPFLADLYAQVERPRVNLGGSEPPGRAD